MSVFIGPDRATETDVAGLAFNPAPEEDQNLPAAAQPVLPPVSQFAVDVSGQNGSLARQVDDATQNGDFLFAIAGESLRHGSEEVRRVAAERLVRLGRQGPFARDFTVFFVDMDNEYRFQRQLQVDTRQRPIKWRWQDALDDWEVTELPNDESLSAQQRELALWQKLLEEVEASIEFTDACYMFEFGLRGELPPLRGRTDAENSGEVGDGQWVVYTAHE